MAIAELSKQCVAPQGKDVTKFWFSVFSKIKAPSITSFAKVPDSKRFQQYNVSGNLNTSDKIRIFLPAFVWAFTVLKDKVLVTRSEVQHLRSLIYYNKMSVEGTTESPPQELPYIKLKNETVGTCYTVRSKIFPQGRAAGGSKYDAEPQGKEE